MKASKPIEMCSSPNLLPNVTASVGLMDIGCRI